MGNYFGLLIVAYTLLGFLALGNVSMVDSTETSNNFNLIDYGAIGDGKTNDTQAFLKAWGDLCKSTEATPSLLVPAGKMFLVTPVVLLGPCKSSSIHIEIQGTIVAPDSIVAWKNCDNNAWLVFRSIDNLIVDGSGVINGKGPTWWHKQVTINDIHNDQSCNRPQALRFEHCSGLRLSGIAVVDSPTSHILISICNNTIVSNLRVTAPEDSTNTDGIDIVMSNNVQIHDSLVGTGDDCIAIGTESSWVNISGITCGPGHGISIGSLGKDGAYAKVEEVHVQHCTFNRTMFGVRIKTWPGGSGYVRNITYEDIPLIEVRNPIVINQHYPATEVSAVEISNVRYNGFMGTSASMAAISLNCTACTNIVMESINITSSNPLQKIYAECENAQGTEHSVAPAVPCLRVV